MGARIDLAGQVFGNIKALEFSHVNNGVAHWKVKCLLCGKVFTVSGANLRSGNTTACAGCNKIGLTMEQRKDILERLAKGEELRKRICQEYGISYHTLRTVERRGLKC